MTRLEFDRRSAEAPVVIAEDMRHLARSRVGFHRRCHVMQHLHVPTCTVETYAGRFHRSGAVAQRGGVRRDAIAHFLVRVESRFTRGLDRGHFLRDVRELGRNRAQCAGEQRFHFFLGHFDFLFSLCGQ